MAARSKARKRALDVLYEADLRGEPVLELLDQRVADASPPVAPYATELVRGVQLHRGRIDELLAAYASDWTLDRMPAVDRNVLRIGAYELLWAADVPDGVAISEAVQLARSLSTDASPAFVNGLLARLLELKPALAAEELATEEHAAAALAAETPAEDETAADTPAEDHTAADTPAAAQMAADTPAEDQTAVDAPAAAQMAVDAPAAAQTAVDAPAAAEQTGS
jgi:transcription antitermination protein NusB